MNVNERNGQSNRSKQRIPKSTDSENEKSKKSKGSRKDKYRV